MVNYYRDMWPARSEILAPLTAMTSAKVKWNWTPIHAHANCFEVMKKKIARETLLTYPDFSKPFEIHTDASKVQLGACISPDGKPIAFHSRKLKFAQTKYTTTEQELLSIVETFKEFRNILLGQDIKVDTDHENLTYKHLNSDQVMSWQLFIEEYATNLQYIKGVHNVVADALSRLPFTDDGTVEEALVTIKMMSDRFCYDIEEQDFDANPLSFSMLDKAQKLDKTLMKALHLEKVCTIYIPFMGREKLRTLSVTKKKWWFQRNYKDALWTGITQSCATLA
jgi:hypothetical protein